MNELLKRYEDVIAPVVGWDTDLHIVSGEGAWVTDVEGETYLDFTCGIAVSNLGHRHPAVTDAARAQLDKLWHAGGAFRYESLAAAGEAMASVAPGNIDMFFFMNSGSEAVEGSVKMARSLTGRQGVVVFRGGFHGRTMGSVTYTTSKSKYRQGYHPLLPSVFVTPYPHPFSWGMTQDEAVDYSLTELHRMFRHEITPQEVACFLVEPMQGEGGYYPGGGRFMTELRGLANDNGILLIADEVQTGFGRTGDWFTTPTYGVQPDVIVLGKAIANGLPLSAVGANRELIGRWAMGSHGTTFGGNPISAAAAAATVEALRGVIPEVPALSEQAFTKLNGLKDKHAVVGDVRGLGLMIGVELVKPGTNEPDPEAFGHVATAARERGLLILDCGPDGNVIRFIPPLVVTPDELDRGIDILDEALGTYRP
ncbi:MAG: aminotransferase class III-fold pyridoxal phosphate-dependent enzyme [Acidimicrobiia bacterium]|nr:aminotransferase class III-fold pyridoxal phosphate-dependent enzyme [Acidimicrobiia bacterium]